MLYVHCRINLWFFIVVCIYKWNYYFNYLEQLPRCWPQIIQGKLRSQFWISCLFFSLLFIRVLTWIRLRRPCKHFAEETRCTNWQQQRYGIHCIYCSLNSGTYVLYVWVAALSWIIEKKTHGLILIIQKN